MKPISQQFSDYGLHNDKSTENSPCENFGLRAFIESLKLGQEFKIIGRKMKFLEG